MDEVEETFPETSTPMRNSSSITVYRSIVPWANQEEFIKVYKRLYSPCISDKRWAIDQIIVWDRRCPLPAAVEASILLGTAIIQDMFLEVGKTFCLEKDVTTLYSMAIVRFINLILKTENGEHHTNLTTLARQYNIPMWVLDLRHEAAHAHTPSFPMLRMGVKFAMKYLEDTYWKNQAASFCHIVLTQSNLEENVADVISKFKNVQFAMKKENADISGLRNDRSELVKNIGTLIKKNREKFVEAFVKPGVFLCAEEIEGLLNITGETLFLELENLITLPESLIQFWFTIINKLHVAGLISYFMEMLLLSLEHCTNAVIQKTAVSWVICFVNESYPNAPTSTFSERFGANRPHLSLNRLLYASMKGSHPYVRNAFKSIMDRIGDVTEYYQLFTLVAVYQGFELDEEFKKKMPSKHTVKSEMQDCDSIVFTAQDLLDDYTKERLTRLEWDKFLTVFFQPPVNKNFAVLPVGGIERSEDQNEEEPMYEDVEEKYIIEENDKELTAEVQIIPDINIFQDPEIGDMIYSR